MIPLSPEAERQLDGLLEHYEGLGRVKAAERLFQALERASQLILDDPGAGLAAPRPYPWARRLGFLWIKEGRYWIAYRGGASAIILGVFYDAADIPGRL